MILENYWTIANCVSSFHNVEEDGDIDNCRLVEPSWNIHQDIGCDDGDSHYMCSDCIAITKSIRRNEELSSTWCNECETDCSGELCRQAHHEEVSL